MSTSITPSELLAHMDWVERLAQRLVHDPEQAQDLVQDTWLTALTRPPRHAGNLRAWLGSVLRNQARDAGRAEGSRASRERKTARAEGQAVVEQATVQHEVVELVLKLEEPYRTVLLMRYFQDMAVREIASKQGTRINTVRSQLVRAHGQLRSALDRNYAQKGGRQAWAGVLLGAVGSTGLKGLLASPAVVLASLALLMIAGGTLWSVLGGDRQAFGPNEFSLRSTGVLPTPTPSLVGPSQEHSIARDREAAPRNIEDSEANIGGTVLLEVVDETSGAPLTNLAYIVYEEGAGKTLLAQGRTDARGRARITQLPYQDVLIIRTERQAPHAAAFGAVWLTGERSERARIEVGSGSTLTGHVQDEVGGPLAGIEVRADTRPQAGLSLKNANSFPALKRIGYAGTSEFSPSFDDPNEELLAITDAKGNWRIEHMASMPRGVWIVEGEPRPESWLPMKLTIRDPRWGFGRVDHPGFMLGEASSLDLGSTTFLRLATLAGQVLDARGNPMPELLVFSSNDQLLSKVAEHGSYSTTDARLDGHVTGADGRFSVPDRTTPLRNTLIVWEPSGAFRSFRVAENLQPGQIKADLKLTLVDKATLHLQLLDPEGQPIKLSKQYGPHVRLGMEDGRRQQMGFVPRNRGKLTYLLDDPLSALESIEVSIPFYYPRWIRFEYAGGSSQSLEVQLQPMPRLDLQMNLEFDKDIAGGLVQLNFRKGSPQGTSQRGPRIGRGSKLHSIPLYEPGTYWIEFSPAYGFEGSVLRGPFDTNQGPYELTITKQDWQAALSVEPSAPEPAPEHKTIPPEPNQGPLAIAPGKGALFSLKVIDSITGRPLPGARIGLRMADPKEKRGGTPRHYFDATTETTLLRAFAGSFSFWVYCKGYAQAEIPGPIQAKEGERVDLGSISMERLTEVICLVLDEEGKPLPGQEVDWSMGMASGRGKTDAAGQFQIQQPDGSGTPYLTQWDSNARWDRAFSFTRMPEASTNVRFVYTRRQKSRITVDVHGYTGQEFFQYEELFLAPGHEAQANENRSRREQLRLVASPDGKLRRYAGHAAIGEHTIVVPRTGAAELLILITIAPGHEPQTFSVSVR